MARRSLTSGRGLTNMWGTGKITRRKVLEYSTMLMAINIREAGPRTRGTGRGHTGWLMPRTNLGGSTLATGIAIPSRAEAPCSTKLEIGTMGCGWTTFPMVKAGWFTPTEMSMRECGIWAREVAMGSSPRESEIILKGIGSMIKDKGRDLTSSSKRTRFLLGSGLMMLQKQESTLK